MKATEEEKKKVENGGSTYEGEQQKTTGNQTQPETMLSSTGFGPPQDLDTDSKSFSISGAHLMKLRFQKLYLGFWQTKRKIAERKEKRFG